MKMRLIGAAILLVVLVPLLILGGLPFQIGMAILAALSFRELIILFKSKNKLPIVMEIFSYIGVIVITLSLGSLLQAIALIIMILFIPLIIFKKNEYSFNSATSLLGIIIFIGITFYSLSYIRLSSIEEFIYLILITILTDTFAYVGGKLLGKHKLIPTVSPNKTVEGSVIGSMVGTLIPCFVYLFYVNPDINIAILIFMTLVISIFGQLGDLLFSSIKRYYKVKDFSNIIPGHGGILDRFDSVLIASIVYVVIKLLFL